jgi:hypothetical protein
MRIGKYLLIGAWLLLLWTLFGAIVPETGPVGIQTSAAKAPAY